MSETGPQGSTDASGSAPVLVGTYGSYAEAEAAVDHLSDEGFPVQSVSIVSAGLRKVEYVTGRKTVFTAALRGAITGLWFGLMAAVFLTLFFEEDNDVSELGFIVSWTLFAAVIVAVWSAVNHLLQRGRRDFAAVARMEAERYEVWVGSEHADHARGLLRSLPAAKPLE